MALSDDERHRIYEEEKAKELGRQEAQDESEKAKQAKKRKEKTQGCLGLIILLVAVTVCSVIVFDGDEDGSTSGPT